MIIALNNKCNLTKEKFLAYQKELEIIGKDRKMILCPTNIFIGIANLSNVELGAQNVSSTECGAYTGEVSASQLKSMGVKYCIVGHSERRKYQQETDEEISCKIKILLKEDIIPILCVGEEKEERENGKHYEKIIKELEQDMKNLTSEEKEKIIIAYEPIWAIGTGLIPTNEEIAQIIQQIKEILPKSKVLYGGSANDKNIEELKKIKTIDGYLLGGLSLKPEQLKIFLEKIEN